MEQYRIYMAEYIQELAELAAFCFSRILDDPRIGETLECAYGIYYELHGVDAQTMKFALTDVQLCMVEERDEILEQAEILRKEYPDFYGKLEDFIKRPQ